MPKNGSCVRAIPPSPPVGSASLRGDHRRCCVREDQRVHHAGRRGQLVRLAARFAWVPPSALPELRAQYSPVGSGAGIGAITARTVDFGASDAPLSPDQFKRHARGAFRSPGRCRRPRSSTTCDGVKRRPLNMAGPALVNIYLGKITNWNNPAIKKINPGSRTADHEDHGRPPLRRLRHDVQLQRLPVVRQSEDLEERRSADGTRQLAGRHRRVAQLRRRNTVRQTPGGIGYVEMAYPKRNHLKYFGMQNR